MEDFLNYNYGEQEMAYIDLVGGQLTPEQKRQIVGILGTKGVRLPCPRCAYAHFSLLDGYFNQPIVGSVVGLPPGLMAPGPALIVPSVVTACNRCGFLSQHALGPLGLLPSNDPIG